MATEQAPAQRAEQKRTGLVGTLIKLPFTLLWILILSILTSIVIEWVGIYFGWFSQTGSEHARETMVSELGYLDSQFTRSLLVSSPVQFAQTFVDTTYQWLFVKTGIAGWVEYGADEVGWAGTFKTYLQAAMFVTLMTMTRCVILILTSPLFLLAAVVGFTDGLVSRDLRRFGAGRESAFIYHHAKRLVTPIFLTGWLIYLSLPFSIHPNLFLLPCALLFGLMIAVATSSFKKYL
ncbi:MAG: TIGR03747 family integrating conjugative element membrane protein [Salinicola sp.]|uniref:TIGR03747 family integrating conjugative element membrane protein n=1 Tax=uncultured Salinicola sp. TaxID=1193542 RepID=UPI000C8A8764|nr:TIGR03747 family integrating conjugative element membrane protein [uncultured Salinicola sp.]MAM55824.1 TIGR03747 family integrating conjugative element membrane protein [Salinicola sp.]|tara:strand:- start:658 stop:1362 length:705 start_codon:yes stop_codon:yes gene_type:complete